MSHQRFEQLIICIPLILILFHSGSQLFTADRPTLPSYLAYHGVSLNKSSSLSRIFYFAFVAAFDFITNTSGVGKLVGSIWMSALAGIIVWQGERTDKYQRRGASPGLLLGCLSLPLLFSAQLYFPSSVDASISASLTTLLWLSLSCSTLAIVKAYTAGEGKIGSVSDISGPGLCEILTISLLAQISLAVQDSLMAADTIVCCIIFVYTLHFLLHTLRFSFTPGESITVSTGFSLLATQTIFSTVGHLLGFAVSGGVTGAGGKIGSMSWLRSIAADWTQRAMILDISGAHSTRRLSTTGSSATAASTSSFFNIHPDHAQSVAYYNALITLIIGVLILGLIWFAPFAITSKRVNTKKNRLERRDRAGEKVDVRVGDDGADDEDEQPGAPLLRSHEERKEGRPVKKIDVAGLSAKQIKRRKKLPSFIDESAASPLLDDGPQIEGVPPRPRSRVAASSVSTPPIPFFSYSSPIVWLFLLVSIFGFLWPYIWMEMCQEPFTFIYRYLFSTPLQTEMEWRQENRASEDFPPTVLFDLLRSNQKILIAGFNLSWLTHSLRATIAGSWIVIMLIGVFLCAPSGTARPGNIGRQEKGEGEGNANHDDDDAAALDIPVVTSVSRRRFSLLSLSYLPNILIRKYYHFLAVLLFIPSIFVESAFVALSLTVALAILILIEYIRISRLSPLGRPIHQWMKTYIDQRDSGIVILTHIYLLVGCAIPLWAQIHALIATKPDLIESSFDSTMNSMKLFSQLTKAESMGERNNFDSFVDPRRFEFSLSTYLPAVSGVLILGIGDSFAAIVGISMGRLRWFKTNRTVEGTIAAIGSILLFAVGMVQAMHFINQHSFDGAFNIIEPNWFRFFLSTVLTCLLEAVTTQIDNLFLPIFYYTCMLIVGV